MSSLRVFLALAGVTSLGFVATADNVNSKWQTAGGGDLADPANWSLGEDTFWHDTQSADNYVHPVIDPVETGPLVFTASVDCCFSRLAIHQGSSYAATTYVFDIGKDRTLSFNGTGDASIWAGVNSGKRGNIIWKSGTYTLREGANGKNQSFRFTTSSGSFTNILDGADTRFDFNAINVNLNPGTFLCVTNGAYLRGKLSGSGTRGDLPSLFLVTGRDPVTGRPSTYDSRGITLKDSQVYVHDTWADGQVFQLRVENGGVVTNFYGTFGNRGDNARLVVGDGGSLYGPSESDIGTNDRGGIVLGGSTTGSKEDSSVVLHWPTNNALVVERGGRLVVDYSRQGIYGKASVTVGSQGSGHLFAVDGGEADLGSISIGNRLLDHSGNTNNTVRFSNGARVNVSMEIAATRAPGGLLDVSGTGTLVTVRTDALGAAGGGLSFTAEDFTMRVRDGAVVTNQEKSAGTRFLGNGARLEVLNGGRFVVTNGVSFGGTTNQNGTVLVAGGILEEPEGAEASFSLGVATRESLMHTFTVGTDGLVRFYRFRMYGYDNRLVVSNGTLEVGSEFRTTYSNTAESGGRTTVVFAGSRPRFLVKGSYADFQREATLRFEVPAEGYETVPFEAAYGFTIKDCRAEFDVDRYRRAGGGTLTLMRAATAITMSDEQLATLREGLPAGCKLWLSDDRTELLLKAPPYAMLMIIR